MIEIPTLETERLVLRPPAQRDYEPYADFLASERSRMVGGPMHRLDAWRILAGVIGHWQLRGFGRWILDAKDGETSLGLVGLHYPEGWPEPEIGWTLFQGEGKGFAYEAAFTARAYAYDRLGWTTAISLIAPDNARSAALGKRMGARFEGTFAHAQYGQMHVWRHPSSEELS